MQYFDGDGYHALLTLGMTEQGMSVEDLQTMEKQAVKELLPSPDFEVQTLHVFQCEEKQETKYRRFVDLPLKL